MNYCKFLQKLLQNLRCKAAKQYQHSTEKKVPVFKFLKHDRIKLNKFKEGSPVMQITAIQPQPPAEMLTAISDDQKVKVAFNPKDLSLQALNPQLAKLVFLAKTSLSLLSPRKNDPADVYRGVINFTLQPNLNNSSYINQLKSQLSDLNLSKSLTKLTLVPGEFVKLNLRVSFKLMNYTRLTQQNVRVQSSIFDQSVAPVQLTLNYPVIAGKSKITRQLNVVLPFESSADNPVTQSNFALDVFYRLSADLNTAQFVV